MKTQVRFTKSASKGLDKAPPQVQTKLRRWVSDVERNGLASGQLAGYRDEALSGQRQGQRSIRLNQQWRAIYTVDEQGIVLVTILEVTPHDYRTR